MTDPKTRDLILERRARFIAAALASAGVAARTAGSSGCCPQTCLDPDADPDAAIPTVVVPTEAIDGGIFLAHAITGFTGRSRSKFDGFQNSLRQATSKRRRTLAGIPPKRSHVSDASAPIVSRLSSANHAVPFSRSNLRATCSVRWRVSTSVLSMSNTAKHGRPRAR